MVEGLAEFAVELVGWVLEAAVDWFSDHGNSDDEHRDQDAIGRYANSLYEERPLPPINPQDLN